MQDSRREFNWISKNLIEVLPAAVYVCNLEGVIVAFNRRATELWGRTPKVGDTDERFCGSPDVAPNLSPANADANQLEMAVLNLCLNARDAMPNGGTIAVRLASETIASGTGLGLSIVEGLVSQLGGALALRSKLGSGTTVEIWLPISAELIGAEQTSITTPQTSAIGTVLLVDDEDLVRASTADMLTDSGFIVVEAASGAEALKILQQELHFDFLVTDYMMPKMTGVQLADAFRHKHPILPYCSFPASPGQTQSHRIYPC